jgi:branched-chain amino acid transport system permease protein
MSSGDTVEAVGRRRWKAPWLLPVQLLCALGLFYLLEDDLGFATQVVIYCILALSLSLIMGQAGIASMGHAALFGSGAYAAGLAALHLSSDPFLGLLAGAAAGSVAALVTGSFIVRAHGLTLVMLTIAAAQVIYEIANKAVGITGGDNGLSGYQVAPLLGRFTFDLYGRVGYWYAMAVLLVVYYAARKIGASPFGLTIRAIRQDPGRMTALGCNVYGQLLVIYCIGGSFAGLAGALSAQIAGIVSLNELDFGVSITVPIMVVLGGLRRLEGAVVGAVAFMVIQHVASTINPYNWLFAIGGLLIVVLLVLPNGIIDLWDRAVRLVRGRGKPRD